MLAIRVDATRDESLREAGVEHARGFIAALANNVENVFVILSAKTLNPRLTVVTRASEEDAEEKSATGGSRHGLSPFSITGHPALRRRCSGRVLYNSSTSRARLSGLT